MPMIVDESDSFCGILIDAAKISVRFRPLFVGLRVALQWFLAFGNFQFTATVAQGLEFLKNLLEKVKFEKTIRQHILLSLPRLWVSDVWQASIDWLIMQISAEWKFPVTWSVIPFLPLLSFLRITTPPVFSKISKNDFLVKSKESTQFRQIILLIAWNKIRKKESIKIKIKTCFEIKKQKLKKDFSDFFSAFLIVVSPF
jgi:hypothetical protein